MKIQRWMTTAAILLVAGSASSAWAHGKVGLWTVTVLMKSSEMPDLSKMPPDQQAEMRRAGVTDKGMKITGQHCMTAAEVAVNDFSAEQRKDKTCKIVGQKISGGSMEADLVCDGVDLKGKGHMKFVFDSDTHYTGQMSLVGTRVGKPLSNDETFEGRWLKADCSGVKT